jgi:hypothetical protein
LVRANFALAIVFVSELPGWGFYYQR